MTAAFVELAAAEPASRFGGKASHLAQAVRAGLPVPPGLVMDVEAVERLVAGDAPTRAQVEGLPERLGGAVAARSSAVGEDGQGSSFAGQHETVLNVLTGPALVEAIRRVHASGRSPGALSYRNQRGIAGEPQVAVLVQKLVDPESAGVLFTINPVTGADELVVEAAWGLGEAVVAGTVTPDTYRLGRDGRVMERTAGDKDLAIVPQDGGGTREAPVASERAGSLCLDDGQLAELHALASACERAFGSRLDLEWAFAGGKLYLLQWRPVTTARPH